MFEMHCLGLGGRVQAPCYSGRCPAEGARELPEERVHAGKPPSASAAGKGASCNLCTLVEMYRQAGFPTAPESRCSGRGQFADLVLVLPLLENLSFSQLSST